MKNRSKRLKKQEISALKKHLLERRQQILGDVNSMENQALKNSRQSASGDLSNMPIHMADIGSDNYEQEFTVNLIQTENVELQAIDAAIEKIDSGTYGLCEACGEEIPKSRLRAIPHARLCIECKREEELKGE